MLAPIRFTNIRRNEVKGEVLASSARTAMGGGRVDLYLCTAKDISSGQRWCCRMCTM